MTFAKPCSLGPGAMNSSLRSSCARAMILGARILVRYYIPDIFCGKSVFYCVLVLRKFYWSFFSFRVTLEGHFKFEGRMDATFLLEL